MEPYYEDGVIVLRSVISPTSSGEGLHSDTDLDDSTVCSADFPSTWPEYEANHLKYHSIASQAPSAGRKSPTLEEMDALLEEERAFMPDF